MRGRFGRPPLDDLLFLQVSCVLAVALTIALTWGIWSPGMPLGDDTSAHVVRAQYAIDHLFTQGQLDGWQSSFGLGYQEFLFLGPGFSVLVALLVGLSFGTMSTLGACKLAVVLTFCALPLAVAFLASAFGLGRRAAGVAAILSLAVSCVFGGAGLASVFDTGLVPNLLGSVLLCLALGGVVLIVRRPTRHRVVGTGLCVALLVATHPLATIALAFFAVAVTLAAGIEWFVRDRGHLLPRALAWLRAVGDERAELGAGAEVRDTVLGPPVRRLAALGLAAAVAVGAAAFLVVPLVAHAGLKGQNSTWADEPIGHRLAQAWQGDLVFRPGVLLLVVAGFAFVVVLACLGRPMMLTLALTPVLYLVMARLLTTLAPDNAVSLQLTNRSLADVGLLAVLPLAVLVAAPRHVASTVATVAGVDEPGARRFVRLADFGIPMLVALAIVVLPPGLLEHPSGVVRPTPIFERAAATLAQVVPPGARFAAQRSFRDEHALTGMSHHDLWLPWATGRDTLNIYNLESSTVFEPVYEADDLDRAPAEEKAATFARLGVTHVLVIDRAAAPRFEHEPHLRQVWAEGSMAIYEVVAPAGQPAPRDLASAPVPLAAQLTRTDPEHLELRTRVDEATDASIAIAWSPKWHLAVDGATVPTGRTDDDLLSVPLPAGEHTVTVEYGPDAADALGRALTLATIVVVALALVLLRRRARASRARAGAADAGPRGDDERDDERDDEGGDGDVRTERRARAFERRHRDRAPAAPRPAPPG